MRHTKGPQGVSICRLNDSPFWNVLALFLRINCLPITFFVPCFQNFKLNILDLFSHFFSLSEIPRIGGHEIHIRRLLQIAVQRKIRSIQEHIIVNFQDTKDKEKTLKTSIKGGKNIF